MADLPTSAPDRVPAASSGVRCDICARPATISSIDPVPMPTFHVSPLPDWLPPVQLCDVHWSQYRSDWLLLGWCDGHYAQALVYCPLHEQEVQPL